MYYDDLVISIGLLANMSGVIIAFFYGYPQPSHEEGSALIIEDATTMDDGRTAEEHDEDVRKRKKKYRCRASFGLRLMFFGFLLQLIGVWL